MKNKNNNNQSHHIHQRIEYVSRHWAMLVLFAGILIVGVVAFDRSIRDVARQVYGEGFAWIGTYMHHEHPAHLHLGSTIARTPTISGPG